MPALSWTPLSMTITCPNGKASRRRGCSGAQLVLSLSIRRVRPRKELVKGVWVGPQEQDLPVKGCVIALNSSN
jgi:hypothetical protein